MRPGLRWLLAATLLLSAFALWWPQEPPSAPSGLAEMPVSPAPAAWPGHFSEASTGHSLPSRLPVQRLDPARFDPFVGVVPPPPPQPEPVPVVAPPPAPPPAPVAPPLAYRYLGRMTDPSGVQRVYLGKADTAVAVAVGARLEEGYVVEEIGPAAVRLHYPPLGAHAVIPLPPEPDAPPR